VTIFSFIIYRFRDINVFVLGFDPLRPRASSSENVDGNFDVSPAANFLIVVRTLSRLTEATVQTGISRGYTMYNIILSYIACGDIITLGLTYYVLLHGQPVDEVVTRKEDHYCMPTRNIVVCNNNNMRKSIVQEDDYNNNNNNNM